jgi:hypothetical protein
VGQNFAFPTNEPNGKVVSNMQGAYDDDNETIDVTLSYDNVQALYEAMQHMRGNSSHGVFTLSKRQMDGTMIVVRVDKAQNNRDWKGA